jgi:hypothetical protein
MVLVDQLPPESATVTAIRNAIPEDELEKRRQDSDASRAPWSVVEGLLATLIDEVRYGNWLFAQANSERKIQPPTPIPRPGIKPKERHRMSIADIKALDPRLRDLPDEEALAKYRELTGRG